MTDRLGRTPLHYAAFENDVARLRAELGGGGGGGVGGGRCGGGGAPSLVGGGGAVAGQAGRLPGGGGRRRGNRRSSRAIICGWLVTPAGRMGMSKRCAARLTVISDR